MEQVFADAALREYRTNKEVVFARNIFESGLKKYGTQVGFILTYIDFLIQLNDDNNTRALFEKVATRLSAHLHLHLHVVPRYVCA